MRQWLKDKRIQSGKTVAKICEELNISESYYFRIENGERLESLDIDFMKKLSKVFGMDINEIVNAELCK